MNYATIEKYLSKSRLNEYKNKLDTDDNNIVIEHYLYNISLSKSFYFLLQNLEITLRNAINNELLQVNQNWLLDKDFLDNNEIKKIGGMNEIVQEISRKRGCRINDKSK